MAEEQHDVTEAISTVDRLLKSARNENEAMIALCTEIAMLNSQNRKLQERLTRVFMELERVKDENEKLRGGCHDDISNQSHRDGSSTSSKSSYKRSVDSKSSRSEKLRMGKRTEEKVIEDALVKQNFIKTTVDIHRGKEPQPKAQWGNGNENKNNKGLGRRMSPFEEQLRDAIKGRFVNNSENENPINPFGKMIIPNYNPDGPLFRKENKDTSLINNKIETPKTKNSNVESQNPVLRKPFPVRRMASYDVSTRGSWHTNSQNDIRNSRTESFLYDLHY